VNLAAGRSGVLTEPGTPSVPARPPGAGRAHLVRLVPWLAPVMTAVGCLLALDVPLQPILTYGAYFGGCVVLPGVLLLRAAWRSTGNWAEDVGLGSAVGMAYQLLGWAIFTALGVQPWLLAWPLLVVVAFTVVPRLRRYWRIAVPAPLPAAWSWGMAICTTAMVVYLAFAVLADHKPPPDGASYYQDLLFHLSMVQELVRSVPPELPQVAGLPLEYHWFANADMAGAVDITRISPALVLFRLWLLPQAVVAVLLCAVLARQVSTVWWTGVLAALAVLPTGLASVLSPSLTFSVVTSTAAAVFFIDALFRHKEGLGVWLLAAALAVVGGGSKPSTLPLLLGGVGLAALFLLVRDRKLPWRLVIAGLILVFAMAGTLRFVAGSTSGSGLQFLAIAKFEGFYRSVTGDTSVPGTGGLLIAPLTSGDSTIIAGVAVTLGLILLSYTGLLTGFGVLLVRSTRCDPVAWMLAGTLTAAWLGMLLVNHPAASQLYFLRGVVPFGAAAACWLAAVAFAGRTRRSITLVVVAALALGLVFQPLSRKPTVDPTTSRAAQVETLARPLLTVVILTAVLVAGWLLSRRLWPRRPGLGVALTVVLVITAGLAGMIRYSYYAFRTDGTYRSAAGRVGPDQQAAAAWLGTHSARTDVVLTGGWCRVGPRKPGCDARGFLISGIAGRRTLLEGWAYTQQALATNGLDGKGYAVQASPWPERVNLTDQVLTAPTPKSLDEARRYGVRWIFADPADGPVSAKLDELAVLRYRSGEVRIYEIG
jgi:hypothetical protein